MDKLYKGHFKGLDISFCYVITTEVVNDAVLRHDCDPVAAHILGRAMTGAILAAGVRPENQRVNLSWKYKGALRTLVVDAGADGTVRSFLSPAQLSSEDSSIKAIYGDGGDLQVVTLQGGEIINSGTSPVPFQDPVKDLGFFFSVSEQIETGMSAMIGFSSDSRRPVSLSQGWMIQALADSDLERFDRIRNRMEGKIFREILSSSGEGESYIEKISKSLVEGENGFEGLQLESGQTPRFECTCSLDKMAAVLKALPYEERMDMVKKAEPVGIRCQSCNKLFELTIPQCINAWHDRPLDAVDEES